MAQQHVGATRDKPAYMAEERTRFGAKVRAIRLARGWTTTELASRLGVSRQAIEHWESGRRSPPEKRWERIASVLGVEVALDLRPSAEAMDEHAAEIVLRLAEVLPRIPHARRKALVAQVEELEERYGANPD
jgi:HTH-type transcriptional regulator/antitoxin HipB